MSGVSETVRNVRVQDQPFEGLVRFRQIEGTFSGDSLDDVHDLMKKTRSEFSEVLSDIGKWIERGVPPSAIATTVEALLNNDYRSVFVPIAEYDKILEHARFQVGSRFSPLTGRCLLRKIRKGETACDTKHAEVGSFGALTLSKAGISARVPDTFDISGLAARLREGHIHILMR